jgi:hypothetical protein
MPEREIIALKVRRVRQNWGDCMDEQIAISLKPRPSLGSVSCVQRMLRAFLTGYVP